MKRFTLLQIATWLFAIFAGIVANLWVFNTYVEKQQKSTQKAVQGYLNLLPDEQEIDPQYLAEQLFVVSNLNKVTIKNAQGDILVSKSRAPHDSIFIDITQAQFDTIRNQFAVNHDGSLRVEFVIDASSIADAFQSGLVYFLLFITLACLMPVVSLRTAFSSYRKDIGNLFTSLIEQFTSQSTVPVIDADLYRDKPEKARLARQLTPALGRLTRYLRSQHEQIESSADEVKLEAYKDVVTELGNRNMFVEFYERNIEKANQESFGCIALVRGTELQTINQDAGYQKGDEYIRDVADMISSVSSSYNNSQVFRLNSSDFAIVLPNTPVKESERFATALQAKFNQYQQHNELPSVAFTGIVPYTQGTPVGELLSNVDVAMSIAQTKQDNAWHIQRQEDMSQAASLGAQNWRKIINELLETKNVELVIQGIMPLGNSNTSYSEILARFKDGNGDILPTSSFLAMAEQVELLMELDQLIIEQALDVIKKRNLSAHYFALNISASSAQNNQFVIWLERRLLREGPLAAKLVFEITEFGLQQNIPASQRFIAMIHRAGARITVERFGVGLTSFKFFRELKPDFIKMDASYTRGLENDKNNQYFMRLMVDLAHRIGVKVFSEGVESQEEKHIIEQLCLDGAQGYYIEKPREL